MTPRTFWNLLIKILGIYTILSTLGAVPQYSILIMEMLQNHLNESPSDFFIGVSYVMFTLSLLLFLIVFTLFKTNWVIDRLKLDKGYEDERFEFNIHRSTLLKVVIMITGGLILINNFPLFCRNAFYCFQQTATFGGYSKNPQFIYTVISLLECFIGYILLSCNRLIINFIEMKRRNSIALADTDVDSLNS